MAKKNIHFLRKKCHHSYQHRNELSYSLLQLWLEYYLKEYSESRNNFRNFPADRLLTQALVGFSCRSLFIESFVFKSVLNVGGWSPIQESQVCCAFGNFRTQGLHRVEIYPVCNPGFLEHNMFLLGFCEQGSAQV